ncbi:YbaY family lipoprotein [Endozoicomonas sp. SM1973]|uniref:YbaY family lipoprotein n=1 Tax=Spartinivicinus marinus TaxID=2994442 RepID=A0A853IIB8_9GAMM|nr:YbaY family lipoprotein [Spartinivicinus marinus]MCX4025885.1 YbaY family lipoprotein [Spartinivicinus marinus]NYZ68845.1 YbaY family lipoprotein [Spartinivicinus marinus]
MKQLILILFGLSIQAVAVAAELKQVHIAGTVNYSETVALPENATFKVRLIDVSIRDAKSKVISEQSMKVSSQPGFYQLPVDLKYIKPSNNYEVEAFIKVDGKNWFLNTSVQPAFTKETQDRVDLKLDFVK